MDAEFLRVTSIRLVLVRFEGARGRPESEPAMLKKLVHLPVDALSPPKGEPNPKLPQVVTDWFESLRKLEPVPFRYLVPDERMLPVESIRFFEIDSHWIDCLVDGAFSHRSGGCDERLSAASVKGSRRCHPLANRAASV